MSDLFFANLGIPNYEYEMENAKYRFRDFLKYLKKAKENEEKKEYSINWKILREEILEEIIKYDFIRELKSIEAYEDFEEKSIEELILSDTDLKTKLQFKIQEEIDMINKGKITWIKIYDKKKKDNSFKIIQLFFRKKYIYDDWALYRENRIKVLKKSSNYNALAIEKIPKKSDEIFIRYKAIPLERQISAMLQLKDKPDPINIPLLKLIMNKSSVDWPDFELKEIDEWFYLKEDDREGIEMQREFVRKALSTPDYAILEGPPGSGKTFTICELILQAINNNKRILLCASTHVAVDNVLEKIKDEPSIIAIRIGLDNISENVRDCQIDEIDKYEKRKIIKRLNKKKRKGTISTSQEYLLECLKAGKSQIIKDIFLEAANLICGTTIGILNHPEINNTKSVKKTTYDYLILDEASKTTFQEFLVPALFAKKWIIAGDCKQLSPFINPEDIEGNIRGLIAPIYQQLCLDIFECYRSSKYKIRNIQNLLVIENDEKLRQFYEDQAKLLSLDCLRIENTDRIDLLELLTPQIIICNDNTFLSIARDIPPDFQLIRGDCNSKRFLRRKVYWNENFNVNSKRFSYQEKEMVWAYELAWRLIRSNETRFTSENFRYYEDQIEALYPIFLSVNGQSNEELFDNMIKEIDLIKRISIPSIIQCLQEGIRKNKNARFAYTLSDGFDEESFQLRHTILNFQYRMHSDISEFSRNHIYDGNALRDCKKTDRNWKYPRYNSHITWVDTLGKSEENKNENKTEVKNIIYELQKFIEWAEKNESKKVWEIAILTFYNAQERLIRKELRKKFHSNAQRYFRFPKKNVSIELCVVDRFQGHEADIVFLSFVQTYREGFLNSVNRLNVALTRAKYQLVIFGKFSYYKKRARSEILNNLAEYCDQKKIFYQLED